MTTHIIIVIAGGVMSWKEQPDPEALSDPAAGTIAALEESLFLALGVRLFHRHRKPLRFVATALELFSNIDHSKLLHPNPPVGKAM